MSEKHGKNTNKESRIYKRTWNFYKKRELKNERKQKEIIRRNRNETLWNKSKTRYC